MGLQSKEADKCQQQQSNIFSFDLWPGGETLKEYFEMQWGVSSGRKRLLSLDVIQRRSLLTFNLLPCDIIWAVITTVLKMIDWKISSTCQPHHPIYSWVQMNDMWLCAGYYLLAVRRALDIHCKDSGYLHLYWINFFCA